MKHKSTALSLTLARINIGLVINKLIVRQKHKSTSEQQKEGILVMLNDLEQVRITLVESSKENEKLYGILSKLHTENLTLKKQILELTTKENNIEL
jgi:hypothetical protein